MPSPKSESDSIDSSIHLPDLAIAHGRITKIDAERVTGWLYSPTRDVTPVLIVDGRPARLVAWPTKRDDVARALGITDDTGFTFEIDGARSGAELELHALSGQRLYKIRQQYIDHSVSDLNVFRQLDRIAKISKEHDAVAITSWDGAHNPIGRAKVLYDIIKNDRPAALITYIFDEFGGKLWEPLANNDIALLTIPWNDRARYHRMLRQMKVNFPTVWICKPRLPNFQLASQIADTNAKLLLDLDDNEDHFSASQPSRTKIYGLAGLGYSRYFQSRILARTVASATLRDSFGGEMVRHARLAAPEAAPSQQSSKDSKKHVAFIGTVRPHKNILAAAKSISVTNWRHNLNVQFHVYGDVQPESLRKELLDQGVELRGIIPAEDLQTRLSAMDLILTGFPSPDNQDDEVTKYQITSKIGDALAVKRPVLVPNGPSVADLQNIPGVFLFTEFDFPQKIVQALSYKGDINLPTQFTLAGAYESFQAAEKKASKLPRASEVFADSVLWQTRDTNINATPTLLLLWKQHDAGIYGRRIDQVARAYKREYPTHKVRVLELWHEKQEEGYKKRSPNYLSDASNVIASSSRKLDNGYEDQDGVIYEMVKYRSSADLEKLVFEYLTDRSILPSNTVVVLYPFIQYYEKIQDLFSSYPKIADVVDNHFSWSKSGTDRSRQVALQYNIMMANVNAVVFNSAVNMDYFRLMGAVSGRTRTKNIPNWYLAPNGVQPAAGKRNGSDFNIVYSGNMNDRIDWGLVHAVAGVDRNIVVHLVGAAERAPLEFYEALKLDNVIYHGPQTESFSLALLVNSQLAIMPHVPDEVSNYMNPMKLHMYQAVGIPILATQVEGIDVHLESVILSRSYDEFIDIVRKQFLERDTKFATLSVRPGYGKTKYQDEYLELIKSIAPWHQNS